MARTVCDGLRAICVAKIQGQFALGADGVILHGATPTELEPILAAYSGSITGR